MYVVLKNDGGLLMDGMGSVDEKDRGANANLSLMSTGSILCRGPIGRLAGFLHRIHWFNYVFFAITLLMVLGGAYVVYVAFKRPSGSSGIDAGKLTEMRFDANLARPA